MVDTGERTTGRGRIGTYYALPATTGCALVASLAPEGIVAEAVDVYGDVVARSQAPVTRSPGAGQVARTLKRVAGEVADRAVPARRRQRRRSRGPRDRAARRAAGRAVPARRARPARRAGRPGRRAASPSTTTSTGRPAPSTATARGRDGLRLPVPRRRPRLRRRQRRRGPARSRRPGRRDRPRGDGRPRRRGDAADRRLRRARPSPARLDRDRRAGAAARRGPTDAAESGARWRAPSPACSRPWWRWPIRRSCWSAGRGAGIRACWPRWRASSRTRRATSRSKPPP